MRCVRKEVVLGMERRESGREFQIVGAAKEKERRPISVLTNGLDSRFRSDDLRFLEGMCGCRSSSR